jgi:DNA invertase Pin-like site-specific DNA recombinase
MKYGYARVSSDGQSVGAQVAALRKHGAGKVFREVASGAKTNRAQLRHMIDQLEAGDQLMVTRLERLARSTRDLLNTLAAIAEKKARFRSLTDTWADTTTSQGRLMLTVLGGLAEFERDLIRARTGEGRARAVARGVKMGRPPKLTPHERQEAIKPAIRARKRLPTSAAVTTSARRRFRDSPGNRRDMSGPKTEHYVPQSILRQFLVDHESKEQVSVYDKHEDRGFVTSIKNVLAENRFHDFLFEDWIVSFEPIASKIENWCLPTYRRIIESRRLDRSPQEKADLAFLIAFQMLRTKATRVRFQEMEAMMRENIETMGHRMEDVPDWGPQTEDTVKRNTLMAIRETLPSFAQIIAQKEFRLAQAAPGRSFYLGDNPVCLHNTRHENLGLTVPGIEIYLPLSSNLMLCAWCPSIWSSPGICLDTLWVGEYLLSR